MKDEFINRLDMFRASLGSLTVGEHRGIWEGKAPVVFTAKVAEAEAQVAILAEAQKRQETGLEGGAQEKAREEAELEQFAYIVGQALVLYFQDHREETLAGEVDLTPSDWAALRDQQLLARSQTVIDRAKTLVASPAAAKAAEYGISAEAVEQLIKERQDFDEIVNAPAVSIALRKALTVGLRPAFSLVEKKFKELDKLILQFGKSPEGRELIAAWEAARILRGPGSGSSRPAVPTPGAVAAVSA